jgi:glutathione S-transferase
MFDNGQRMTESAAICQYLAARYGAGNIDVPASHDEFGAYLNWLHFGEATLTFPQTLVLRYSLLEPEERRLPQAVEDYSRWFLARLRGVDAAVVQHQYLCAGRFTAADVSVGYALMLADYLGLAQKFSDGVREYWLRLQQREAFQRALAAQESAALAQGISPRPAPLAGDAV